jgi:hypothetical protein
MMSINAIKFRIVSIAAPINTGNVQPTWREVSLAHLNIVRNRLIKNIITPIKDIINATFSNELCFSSLIPTFTK